MCFCFAFCNEWMEDVKFVKKTAEDKTLIELISIPTPIT
jgi:hypothetical protein